MNGGIKAFVQAECANWSGGSSGRCWIHGDCRLLRTPPDACEHFEKAVLPLVRVFPKRYGAMQAACEGVLAGQVEDYEPRRCACGATIEPRQRLCEACKMTRRRESTRRSMAKCRGLMSVSS